MTRTGPRIGYTLLALIVGLIVSGPATAQRNVDLELIMAVDVSGSVDSEEYALQMGGIADAF